MSQPLATDRDYRKIIIPRWVSQEFESFPKPSREELERMSRYSAPLIERFIPEARASAILEVGCGFGSFLLALTSRGYKNIRAIDLIPECCAFVEEQIGIKPECTDLLDFLARDEGRYDAIVAFDVIEHFNKNEIVAIVERLYEVLNPGGVFIMRVPNGGSLSGLSVRYSGFTHETAFTQVSIHELFRAIGFRDVECIPDPIYAESPVKGAVKHAIRWTAERLVSLGTLFSIEAAFAVSKNVTGVGWKR
jgi:2-polyprenyl-3-methyl-5-hydroxy-6-metoxy-1,4-benzoquinol methylase